METREQGARRRNGSIPVKCEACGAPTKEPRKGMCIRCYRRFKRGSPALRGSCELCGLVDQRLLRAVRSGTKTFCLCHNCGWLAERYAPKPIELEGIRSLVSPPGNRRRALDRRRGERRGDQRRSDVEERRIQPRILDKGDRRLTLDRRSRP